MQGFALAFKLKATKKDFDELVLGIHPTDGEGLIEITATKTNGIEFRSQDGW